MSSDQTEAALDERDAELVRKEHELYESAKRMDRDSLVSNYISAMLGWSEAVRELVEARETLSEKREPSANPPEGTPPSRGGKLSAESSEQGSSPDASDGGHPAIRERTTTNRDSPSPTPTSGVSPPAPEDVPAPEQKSKGEV